jgi:predicted RNA methylase
MTRMEQRMAALETAAQKAFDDLRAQLGAGSGPPLAAAAAALGRFKDVNREIVTLSRRNSEVRSLALSLGRKRMVTAVADDQLSALEAALAKHEFTATR